MTSPVEGFFCSSSSPNPTDLRTEVTLGSVRTMWPSRASVAHHRDARVCREGVGSGLGSGFGDSDSDPSWWVAFGSDGDWDRMTAACTYLRRCNVGTMCEMVSIVVLAAWESVTSGGSLKLCPGSWY